MYRISIGVLVALLGAAVNPIAARQALPQQGTATFPSFDEILPLEDFSPAVLGIYRKLMVIEDEIRQHTERYGVDFELARAVCMYESGGNANLTSWAGAKGYFQVMPATFRGLRVETNIEAGVKYLGQLVERFEREDYALAGYNGGPSRVGRRAPMRLESLQYVLGVGQYRSVLKLYELSVRHHASQLQLTTAEAGEDWWAVSRRLQLPLLQLRLHNPYLAHRTLREGYLVAYPRQPRQGLLSLTDGKLEYIARHGDNYFTLAFVFEVDLDLFRRENELWHLQTLPAGSRLRLPLEWEGDFVVHQVAQGDTLESIADELGSAPWRLIRDNGLFWDQELRAGMLLRVRKQPPKPSFVVHRVRSGDTLIEIALRYGTTVNSIQQVNSMGRRTMIRIGESLRVPNLTE